jgi:hypothetical protein
MISDVTSTQSQPITAKFQHHCDVALMASQNRGGGRDKKKMVCDKNKQNFFFIE